jgi:imidazolonepropionase-like amidohydrolase
MLHGLRLFLAALLLSGLFAAPAAAQGSGLLVRAGKVFDSQRGEMLPGRDILIREGRIEKVAPRLELPPGARLLDLSRYAVLPGLIDAHAHLLMQHPGDEGSGETNVREIVREGDVMRALRGAARARSYLQAGFTSVRDVGNAGRFADVALKRVLAEGALAGPRLFVAGPGLSPSGGQMDGLAPGHSALVDHEYRVVRGAEDARVAVREAAAQGVDHIKIYSNSSPNPGYLSVEEMRAAVGEAHLMGLKVTAHATTDEAIVRALDAGVDSIEHGRGASSATLARLKRQGVVLVLTEWGRELLDIDVARQPLERRPSADVLEPILRRSRERIAGAMAAGVEIAFGSDLYVDFGIARGEAARKALYSYVEGGMRPLQALRSATFVAGRLIQGGQAGVIAPGAWADLIAVEGDLSTDIRAIEQVRCVVLNGAVQPDTSLPC